MLGIGARDWVLGYRFPYKLVSEHGLHPAVGHSSFYALRMCMSFCLCVCLEVPISWSLVRTWSQCCRIFSSLGLEGRSESWSEKHGYEKSPPLGSSMFLGSPSGNYPEVPTGSEGQKRRSDHLSVAYGEKKKGEEG